MTLPGRIALARGLITGLRCAKTQVQPCGIDLSLKHVLSMDSAGTIDFDNSKRCISGSTRLPFQNHSLRLKPGVYLVEFNEKIHMPCDVMGEVFVRSSLFRSGAQIHAGVMDSGYQGVIGAMLEVDDPAGIRLYKHARLAQIIFRTMTEPTEGYSGQYQGRSKM
ncbi:hypothetical protein ANO11243_034350 [Dothideomycetidae sp. 11243]|nr:hypothetical protein ANO11243_034350 [fungal sp. No.11243]